MVDELPSPWEASRPFLIVYGLAGVGVWAAIAFLTQYGAVEGIPLGVITAVGLGLGELQAGYRIRWAMGKIHDAVGGATEASCPEARILELSWIDHPVTVRGEVRNFRVWGMHVEIDGEAYSFPPRKAEAAVERIRRSGVQL